MQNWRGGLLSGKDEGKADGDGAGPQMKLLGLARSWLGVLR